MYSDGVIFTRGGGDTQQGGRLKQKPEVGASDLNEPKPELSTLKTRISLTRRCLIVKQVEGVFTMEKDSFEKKKTVREILEPILGKNSIHDNFIVAIHQKRKVRLTFLSKEDKKAITRICAPMDYGQGRNINDRINRYHFWDYESDKGPHPLPLLPERIIRMEILEIYFDPSEFVTWNLQQRPWFIKRDWGRLS